MRFLNVQKHRQYTYTPKYYDQVEDDLQRRYRHYNEEQEALGLEHVDYTAFRTGTGMRQARLSRRQHREIMHRKNMQRLRFGVILLGLIVGSIFVWMRVMPLLID